MEAQQTQTPGMKLIEAVQDKDLDELLLILAKLRVLKTKMSRRTTTLALTRMSNPRLDSLVENVKGLMPWIRDLRKAIDAEIETRKG